MLWIGSETVLAQEEAVVGKQQHAKLFEGSGVAAPTLPPQQYFDELFNPILREQRRIREARATEAARQAQRNATPRPTPMESTRFGNTAYDNFSPYPDRELDARNLSFPMSRDALKRAEQKHENLKMKRAK